MGRQRQRDDRGRAPGRPSLRRHPNAMFASRAEGKFFVATDDESVVKEAIKVGKKARVKRVNGCPCFGFLLTGSAGQRRG